MPKNSKKANATINAAPLLADILRKEALAMFIFERDSAWEQVSKNSWMRSYPGYVMGLVVKVGRKKYVITIKYQKNYQKFFITEDPSFYCDEYEAQEYCDRIVDELNNNK